MAKKQPRYVSLESDAFLSDPDFQAMTAEQRGAYCTIIFYLYRNDGRMKYSEEELRKLCNVNDEFAIQTVLSKFRVRRGFIRHKRVDRELAKAQVFVDRGVKAANARWNKQCSSNAQAMRDQCNETKRNEKESNTTSNTKARALSLSDSVRFADQLDKTIKPRSQSDRRAQLNLTQWLMLEIKEGRRDSGVFEKILTIAKESKGRIPMAVFFSRLDKEIGYRPRAVKGGLSCG